MKFLDFTKKLVQQIAYYDAITKSKINIFNKPIPVTIIWIDEDND